MEIRTTNEIQNMDAVVFRDSFFIFEIDFFSESFHSVEYLRAAPYDIDYAIQQGVDIGDFGNLRMEFKRSAYSFTVAYRLEANPCFKNSKYNSITASMASGLASFSFGKSNGS